MLPPHDIVEQPMPDDLSHQAMEADNIQAGSSRVALKQARERWNRRLLAFIASLLLSVALLLVMMRDYHQLGAQSSTVTTDVHSRVQIVSNILSASAVANGKHLALPATFQPHTGINEVRLIAPPFPTYSCRFQWPQFAIITHSCTLVASEADGHGDAKVYIIGISLGIDALPSELRNQARAELASITLNQVHIEPAAVPKGSRIALNEADGKAHTMITASSLVATVRQQVNPSSAFPASGLSQLAAPETTSGENLWAVRARVEDQWEYIDRNARAQGGAAIATTATITAIFHVTSSSIQLVRFQNDSSTIDFGNSPSIETCLERPDRLAQYLAQYGDATLIPIHEGGEQGCEITLTQPTTTNSHPGLSHGQAPDARFLIRFGCLLAENDQGATLIPDIPRASRIDIDAVISTHAPA
jgi:hypothetical protein